MKERQAMAGKRIGLVLTGGNIDSDKLALVLTGGVPGP
jgi:threonine dehydratase